MSTEVGEPPPARADPRATAPATAGARRLVGPALAAILALALALRLWRIDHGLPFVFNPDEENHFVPIAIGFFEGSFDPGYFENPTAFSYLLHLVFRVRFGEGFPFGSGGLIGEFARDPTAAFLTARVVVALLGVIVVALVFAIARRIAGDGAALLGALLAGVAFLPLAYSTEALNDVPALVPFCVAVLAALHALEGGRARAWLLAGVAAGAATGTKYLAGMAVVAILAAVVMRAVDRRGRARAALGGLALASAAATVVFFALNPYALLDADEFTRQVEHQASVGAERKTGQERVSGWAYYGRSLTWGFGWVPLAAALGGAVVLWRRRAAHALIVAAPALALFVYMGAQVQFYARWIMPVYPLLAVLAGVGGAAAAGALARRLGAGAGRIAAPALVVLALAAQPLAADWHAFGEVRARPDTRESLRAWVFANLAPGTRAVVEPTFPRGFFAERSRKDDERIDRRPLRPPYNGYPLSLEPRLVGLYRLGNFCHVFTSTHQKDRGLAEGMPGARGYYDRLARESDLLARFSPYRPGAEPPPFGYDSRFLGLHRSFARPGPLLEVRRLRDCGRTTP